VYADGDNRTFDRAAAYTISGAGITTTTIDLTDLASTNFSSTFTRASNSNGNYVRFSVTATGFTLRAVPTAAATTTRRAPVNAIQIVPAATAAPDFTIAATPASRTVAAGSSTTYSVTVAPRNGFADTVALSATGLPSGATATFAPASISGSGTSTLTVSTSGSTPAATSTLTVSGTTGPLRHTASVTLDVDASARRAMSVSFMGNHTAPMGAADIAGVVPAANWNNASGAARTTPLALVDETGAATGATITWSSNNTWMTPISDQAGNRRMMKGYLDTSTTSTTTVTVAGLNAGAYDVYVYADGQNYEFARTAAYRISGTGITTTTINLTDPANTNFAGTFTEASGSNGNYVKFAITASGFTLTATPISGGNPTLRAPVNAIQIVPR
jgi:hypothetical protein